MVASQHQINGSDYTVTIPNAALTQKGKIKLTTGWWGSGLDWRVRTIFRLMLIRFPSSLNKISGFVLSFASGNLINLLILSPSARSTSTLDRVALFSGLSRWCLHHPQFSSACKSTVPGEKYISRHYTAKQEEQPSAQQASARGGNLGQGKSVRRPRRRHGRRAEPSARL